MREIDWSEWELTGEFRAPKMGETFLPIDFNRADVVEASGSHMETQRRYIVRKRKLVPVEEYAGYGVSEEGQPEDPIQLGTDELLRFFEIVPLLDGVMLLSEGEDDARLTEADAREAALVTLTQIALDETAGHEFRIEAAKQILGFGPF